MNTIKPFMLEIEIAGNKSAIPVYGLLKVVDRDLVYYRLHERATLDHMGFTVHWLDPANPEPAQVQFDVNYKHGGGWRPFAGTGNDKWTLMDTLSLKYPGDPLLQPLWLCQLRETEGIVVYPNALFMVLNPLTRAFEVARMD